MVRLIKFAATVIFLLGFMIGVETVVNAIRPHKHEESRRYEEALDLLEEDRVVLAQFIAQE